VPTVSLTDDEPDDMVRQNDTVTIIASFSEEMSSAPTISITNGGITGVAMTDGGDGTTWTYEWTVPAGDASAEATVAGADLAGNTCSGGDSLIFAIDNTVPAISGATEGSSYNTDKTITFNEGTAKLNGSVFNSGDSVSLEGSFVLVVTDQVGNSTTVNFTIDKTKPELTVEMTSDGNPYDGNYTYKDVTLTVAAADNIDTDTRISYSGDSGVSWQSYTGPLQFASPGTYEIRVKAVDAAGNESAVITREIKTNRRSGGSSARQENLASDIEILINGKAEGSSAIVEINE